MNMVNGQGGSMDTSKGTRFEICDNKITRFHPYYLSLWMIVKSYFFTSQMGSVGGLSPLQVHGKEQGDKGKLCKLERPTHIRGQRTIMWGLNPPEQRPCLAENWFCRAIAYEDFMNIKICIVYHKYYQGDKVSKIRYFVAARCIVPLNSTFWGPNQCSFLCNQFQKPLIGSLSKMLVLMSLGDLLLKIKLPWSSSMMRIRLTVQNKKPRTLYCEDDFTSWLWKDFFAVGSGQDWTSFHLKKKYVK